MITVISNGHIIDARTLTVAGEGDIVIEDGTIRQSGDADTAVRIIGRLVPEYAPENAGKISA